MGVEMLRRVHASEALTGKVQPSIGPDHRNPETTALKTLPPTRGHKSLAAAVDSSHGDQDASIRADHLPDTNDGLDCLVVSVDRRSPVEHSFTMRRGRKLF